MYSKYTCHTMLPMSTAVTADGTTDEFKSAAIPKRVTKTEIANNLRDVISIHCVMITSYIDLNRIRGYLLNLLERFGEKLDRLKAVHVVLCND